MMLFNSANNRKPNTMNDSFISKNWDLTRVFVMLFNSANNRKPNSMNDSYISKNWDLTRVLRVFKKYIKVSLLIFIFAPINSFGGQYLLEKGQSRAVCKSYLENLNITNPSLPFYCERPANENFGIVHPKWQRLLGKKLIPIGVNLPLEINKYLWKRGVNPIYYVPKKEWPNWKGTPKQLDQAWLGFESQRNSLLTFSGPKYAMIDIDNDGVVEPVYYESGCDSIFGSILIVLKKDFSGIDVEKTEIVLPNISRRKEEMSEFRKPWPEENKPELTDKLGRIPSSDALHSLYSNVFHYRNKYYFDTWWKYLPSYKGKSDITAGKLKVYKVELGSRRQVCQFRFDINMERDN